MNIAYVSADFGIPVFGDKGAAVHIQQMVGAFADLGHDVRLLAARLGQQNCKLPAETLKIRAQPVEFQPTSGDDPERQLKEQRYIRIGEEIERELYRQHAAKPIDVIYERYSLWSAAATRAGRQLGIPVVVEVNAPLILEQRQYRKLVLEDAALDIEREVFSSADLITAVSDEVASYAVEQGARMEQVIVQPNGVNQNVFSPQISSATISALNAGPVIGFSGSLKPWHGLEDLLEAFARLNKVNADTRLLIVGDGPLRPWVEGFVKGAGLSGSVVLAGWQPHSELPAFINAMDIACAPYPFMEDFYFSPLKLIEYMACGRAVVASAIGQINDTIQDGENGMLVEPGNVAQLTKILTELAGDAAKRRKLGSDAAKSVEHHTWRKIAHNTLALTQTNACAPAISVGMQ